MAQRKPYELYYNPFSICSLMVLLSVKLKGNPKPSEEAIEVEEKEIDIYSGEQLSEEFLAKNWKGQVPVLFVPSQSIYIPDSMDITRHLWERYPSLLPAPHEETVENLLQELHAINYFSLSFRPADARAQGIIQRIQNRMADAETSEKYKAALTKKLQFLQSSMSQNPFAPEQVVEEEAKTRAFLQKIGKLLTHPRSPASAGASAWIFGDVGAPTALDAHTIVFIARLLDTGRSAMIEDGVLTWAKQHLESDLWRDMVKGKPTLHTLLEKH